MSQNIDRNTQLCISLASRPGNFGNIFHNFLYQSLNLNFIYKSCSTQNLEQAIEGIRALNIRGCGLSMPFKLEAIHFVDEIDSHAQSIGAINTIVNENGVLKGYNTDYVGVREILEVNQVPSATKTAILGSGGMARAVLQALRDLGFRDCVLFARNKITAMPLIEKYAYPWKSNCHPGENFGMLINATPIGMGTVDSSVLPFEPTMIQQAKYICDVVVQPETTSFLQHGKNFGKITLSGAQIATIQAREQFSLYTGVSVPISLVQQAFAFARSD